jgi:hypothetical protein
VSAAAAALTEDELQDHFSVAVEQGRTVPLPVIDSASSSSSPSEQP